MEALLDRARIPMKLDFSTDDAITPGAVELGYPNEEVSESMARLYAYELLGGKIYRRNGPSLMTLLELSDLDEIVKRFNDVVKPPHPFIRQSRLNGCGFPHL